MSPASSVISSRLMDARSWAYSNANFVLALGLIAVIFATLGLLAAGAPGLYMDAINPYYEVVKILHPDAPITVWKAPEDFSLGRFPVMCGLNAGSYVAYWIMTLAALFGNPILTFRVACVCFGLILLCCIALLYRQLTRSNMIALTVGLALAVATAFVCQFSTDTDKEKKVTFYVVAP